MVDWPAVREYLLTITVGSIKDLFINFDFKHINFKRSVPCLKNFKKFGNHSHRGIDRTASDTITVSILKVFLKLSLEEIFN